MRSSGNRGWWHLISIASAPFLFLARTGLLGADAREQSEAALEDWASYGSWLMRILAVIGLGVIVGALVILLTSLAG